MMTHDLYALTIKSFNTKPGKTCIICGKAVYSFHKIRWDGTAVTNEINACSENHYEKILFLKGR